MITSIGNFLVENGNNSSIGLLVGLVILLIISVLFVAFSKRLEFVCAWNKIRKSLIDMVNSEGLRVSNLLIEIASISAKEDGDTGIKIGMILQQVVDAKDKPNFYTKVLKLMEGINDNNQVVKLNGDYAQIRNSIEIAIELIETAPRTSILWIDDLGGVRRLSDKRLNNPFDGNGFLTDFLIFAEEAINVEKKITRAIMRIEKVLSDLKPHEIFIDEEIVLVGADSDAK